VLLVSPKSPTTAHPTDTSFHGLPPGKVSTRPRQPRLTAVPSLFRTGSSLE
jgi:hypothetical protein